MIKNKRGKGSGGNPRGNPQNLKLFGVDKPVNDHDYAVETGRLGGKKSAEVRRKAKEMDKVFFASMNKAVNGKLREMLIKAGYSEDELTNSTAVFATLVAMAVEGNLKAAELILDYSLSVKEEERKKLESKARIESLTTNSSLNMAVTSSDDDDGGVVIYLPKLEEDANEEQDEITENED